MLLMLLFAANLAFAWTYNVGDAYIFFLPSHYVVALCAGAGVAAIVARRSRVSIRDIRGRHRNRAAGVSGLARLRHLSCCRSELGQSRGRAAQRFHQRTAQMRIFGVDSNWQIQNAFEYFMREHRPGVAWFTTDELSGFDGRAARDRVQCVSRRSMR